MKRIGIESGPFTFFYILLEREPWVKEDGWKTYSAKRLDKEVVKSLSEYGAKAKATAIGIAKKEYQKSLQGELIPKA